MDKVAEKACTRCLLVKPLSEFYVRRASPDGLGSGCKLCHKTDADRRHAVPVPPDGIRERATGDAGAMP